MTKIVGLLMVLFCIGFGACGGGDSSPGSESPGADVVEDTADDASGTRPETTVPAPGVGAQTSDGGTRSSALTGEAPAVATAPRPLEECKAYGKAAVARLVRTLSSSQESERSLSQGEPFSTAFCLAYPEHYLAQKLPTTCEEEYQECAKPSGGISPSSAASKACEVWRTKCQDCGSGPVNLLYSWRHCGRCGATCAGGYSTCGGNGTCY